MLIQKCQRLKDGIFFSEGQSSFWQLCYVCIRFNLLKGNASLDRRKFFLPTYFCILMHKHIFGYESTNGNKSVQ